MAFTPDTLAHHEAHTQPGDYRESGHRRAGHRAQSSLALTVAASATKSRRGSGSVNSFAGDTAQEKCVAAVSHAHLGRPVARPSSSIAPVPTSAQVESTRMLPCRRRCPARGRGQRRRPTRSEFTGGNRSPLGSTAPGRSRRPCRRLKLRQMMLPGTPPKARRLTGQSLLDPRNHNHGTSSRSCV